MNINAIVAMSANKGIGLDNKLPWKCKDDITRFKHLTIGNGNNAIIMGKNTWNSVGVLPRRHNFILTTTQNFSYVKNFYLVKTFHSISELLAFSKNCYDNLWVIGGSQIYKSFLEQHLIDSFYITLISKNIHCDTFMCPLPNYFLKQELTMSNELFDGQHPIYYINYKKINKNMKLIYKDIHDCTLKEIHYDDYPNIYCTIEYDNKECQTGTINLKLNKH
jgi:dihydrofolate reductase